MPFRRSALVVLAVTVAVACAGPGPASGSTHRSLARISHTYTFPIHGCPASYARTHHDYPASDIFAGFGCRFVAPIGGHVDEVNRIDRWSAATDLGSQRGGRSVSIVGNDGVRYYGSHLSGIPKRIRPGVHVRRGDRLGFMGQSGDASAVHLHFGISWTTRAGIWWVRRGEIWPWPFLDAWRSGNIHWSPVRRVHRALRRAGSRVPPCEVLC